MATTERGIYYTTAADNDDDVADLNIITKDVADSVQAALDVVDAVAYATGQRVTGSQVVSGGSSATVTYSAESDPLGMLSAGTVTVQDDGLYMVSGGVAATTTTVQSMMRLGVAVNGVQASNDVPQDREVSLQPPGFSTFEAFVQVTGIYVLSAGDTVALTYTNESSSTAHTIAKARFSVVKIG